MKLLPVILILVQLTGCSPVQHPAIPARKAERPARRVAVYAREGTVEADTILGKHVYLASCNRCHGLPDPQQYTAAAWEEILLRMIPRTRIDTVNAVHVRAYLLAGAVRKEGQGF